MKPPETSIQVDARRCIRCAACATVAPAIFVVERGPARVVRAPETDAERRGVEAAMLLCPTAAIRRVEEAHAR